MLHYCRTLDWSAIGLDLLHSVTITHANDIEAEGVEESDRQWVMLVLSNYFNMLWHNHTPDSSYWVPGEERDRGDGGKEKEREKAFHRKRLNGLKGTVHPKCTFQKWYSIFTFTSFQSRKTVFIMQDKKVWIITLFKIWGLLNVLFLKEINAKC